MKPLGQIITGVQNTIFLSLTTALLSLRLTFEAAEATEPASKLLASLIMDSSLLEDWACDPEALAFAFRCLGGIVKINFIKFSCHMKFNLQRAAKLHRKTIRKSINDKARR